MTERSKVPADLIDLHEAAQLLGPTPIRLIQAGKLPVFHVNGTVMVSRQRVIDCRFRTAGLIPAAEWDGPDATS
ncbi:hypothetical protein [Mycobacteroides abscessus]|uniref:hypothetical protein n=1 Tax=Mycobacteroides abscessus TaxID=36809 RepID=UPI00266FCA01|nr:hypothetical protein [Mycobacteroides abscessus]MDO3110453.1 hypothetical protein [Mycobacteroides abscessus subsp. abscessus]